MKIVNVVGSGMLGVSHLTNEAQLIISNSKKILWLGTINGIEKFIKDNDLNGEDISVLYINGDIDNNNYNRILEKILFDLNKHDDISLVVAGHPRLGVTIVQELQTMAHKGKLKLCCFPGISSFDVMINDLQFDPIEEGTCILDVNRLILYNYIMDPSLNYFIYHVSSIGNSHTDYLAPRSRNQTFFLKEKLLTHYAPDHVIFLVSAATHANECSQKMAGKVGEIELLLEKVTFKDTLFIPQILPAKSRVNIKFLSVLCPELI